MKPHQSNTLHPNEGELGLRNLGLVLVGAKRQNMPRIDVSFRCYVTKGQHP